MRRLISTAFILSVLAGILFMLNTLVWGPLGVIDALNSGCLPEGGYVFYFFVLAGSFIASLIFVSVYMDKL